MREAEVRPQILAIADQVCDKRVVLPAEALELLSRYQTTFALRRQYERTKRCGEWKFPRACAPRGCPDCQFQAPRPPVSTPGCPPDRWQDQVHRRARTRVEHRGCGPARRPVASNRVCLGRARCRIGPCVARGAGGRARRNRKLDPCGFSQGLAGGLGDPSNVPAAVVPPMPRLRATRGGSSARNSKGIAIRRAGGSQAGRSAVASCNDGRTRCRVMQFSASSA